ncbi:hypothetical protein [Geodermatophilus marinus]|nr:hypothetical protein [Geodermatophilus sp. LHW52908]
MPRRPSTTRLGPDEKGARSATGPAAGLFDRMRDAVTGRGQG